MKEAIYRVGTKLKGFFRKKINFVSVLLILNIILTVYVYLEGCNERYHYYRNLNTTIEDVFKVKTDVYDGHLLQIKDEKEDKYTTIKELTTEDTLVRKQNRKWHLKYMFK